MRALCPVWRNDGQREADQIRALPDGVTRAALADALPALGAARNAVDCALWDLEAKVAGRRAWELAGLAAPGPVITAFTLSLDSPENMRAAAAKNAHRPLLKIKLGTPDDMPRLEAVRDGAPKAQIIVDANEGWTAEALCRIWRRHLAAAWVCIWWSSLCLPPMTGCFGRDGPALAGLRG